MSNCDVIVLAAGSGSRAGADKMLFSLTEDAVRKERQARSPFWLWKIIIAQANIDHVFLRVSQPIRNLRAGQPGTSR